MAGSSVIAAMQETKQRFFVFIDKLEEKLKDFTDAAVPELAALGDDGDDNQDGSYYRMRSAVLGQIESIRKKAEAIREEKITCFAYPANDYNLEMAYYDFRNECYARVGQLEDLCSQCREKIANAYTEDYEAGYQKILDAYEAIKNKFRCAQCGSPVVIDKIYFITTYITCQACGTRNTFDPGSPAKSLESLGRSLAEQRTAHLLKKHQDNAGEALELYQQVHALRLKIRFESDSVSREQQSGKLQVLEQQMQDKERQQHVLYQHYLRAMFDEWNNINPSLSEQHERFYERLWKEYMQQHKGEG